MPNIFKQLVLSSLGYENAYELRKYFLKPQFSELSLIYEFFRNREIDNGLMLDVGVHYGESLIPFIDLGWKVIGFEPDPNNFRKIKKHDQLVLESYALSNETADNVEFFVSKESSGISSLIDFSPSHEVKFTVNIKTLDFIVREYNITKVDFLKIDTEGNDLNVLKGLTFENVKPKMILCEFEDQKTKQLNYTYEDMGDYLLSKGYKVYISEWYPVNKYGTSHKWKSVFRYPASIDQNGWGNFIAVDSELDFDFAATFESYLKRYSSSIQDQEEK